MSIPGYLTTYYGNPLGLLDDDHSLVYLADSMPCSRLGERYPPFCEPDSDRSRCAYCNTRQASGTNCKNCGAPR
jgi:hypothetical protein